MNSNKHNTMNAIQYNNIAVRVQWHYTSYESVSESSLDSLSIALVLAQPLTLQIMSDGMISTIMRVYIEQSAW